MNRYILGRHLLIGALSIITVLTGPFSYVQAKQAEFAVQETHLDKALSEQTHPNQAQPEIMTYDVIIDVGHGGIDGGAQFGNVLEKQLNLEIGSALFRELQEKGYQVGITRLHDYALSEDSPFAHIGSRHRQDLTQRQLIADELQPQVFISIHLNVSHPSVMGPMILYQDRAESYLLADLLQQELNKLAQTKQQEKMTNYYFLLKNISSPALIAEVGYMSHPDEGRKLQDPEYQQLITTRMAQAIDQYFVLYP